MTLAQAHARLTAPGVATGDVAAAWDVAKAATLFARVTNVGDVRYQRPTGYLAPGRLVVAGVRLRY